MKRVYILCSAIVDYKGDVAHFVFSADERIKEDIADSEGMIFFNLPSVRQVNLFELYNGKIEAYDDIIKDILSECKGKLIFSTYDNWSNRLMYRSTPYSGCIIKEIIESDDNITDDVIKLYLKERFYKE